MLAARLGHVEALELLLEAGCDPAIPDNRQTGALHWLAHHCLSDVISFLLQEDPDVLQQIDLQVAQTA